MNNYKLKVKNSSTDIDKSIIGLIELSELGPKIKGHSYLEGLPTPWTNLITGIVINESKITYSTFYVLKTENIYNLLDDIINNLQSIIKDIYGVDITLEYILSDVVEVIIPDNLSNNFEETIKQKTDSKPINELIFNVEYEGIFTNIDIGELFIIGREDNFIFDDEIPSEYLEDEFDGEEELPVKVGYEPDTSIDVPSVIDESDNLEKTLVITQPKDGSLTISMNGMKQLIRHEGSRGTVYDDKTGKSISDYSNCGGYPTIGVGHLITNTERAIFSKFLSPGKMTSNAIENLLLKDLQVRIKSLNSKLNIKVTQNQFDALLSMMFNCGANNKNYLKALKQTNEGDFKGAAFTIKSGPNTSKGKLINSLVVRRNDESKQYLA